MDDICVRAQVGRATFFRFYGTKAGLLAEFNRRLAELALDFIAWLIVTALAAATASWLVGHEHADLDRTTADTLDVLLTGLSGTTTR